MTEQDFLDKLAAVTGVSPSNPYPDEESDHIEGDAIVSDALRYLGWVRLADEYDRRREDWWYA